MNNLNWSIVNNKQTTANRAGKGLKGLKSGQRESKESTRKLKTPIYFNFKL